MRNILKITSHARKPFFGKTVAEIMTSNPPLLPSYATAREGAGLLLEQHADAVLVTDELGRPVGVLSHADITQHYAERAEFCDARSDSAKELSLPSGEKLHGGFQIVVPDGTQAQELMTPVVVAASPKTPLDCVATEMIAQHVHQVFVIDDDGIPLGVIDALDILHALYPQRASACQACVHRAA